jgi:A-kinase anchor protein 2 C-terminus
LGETPIEREIRVAGERELELRREKGVAAGALAPAVAKSPVNAKQAWKPALVNDSRDVQHRIATSRIQQEIQEATQREKELVATGTIQTLSEDTVDSKVIRTIKYF